MSLWQKSDTERPSPSPSTPTGPSSSSSSSSSSSMSSSFSPSSAGVGNRSDRLVNIGQSIEIKGELTGNEDLTIDGKVEGRIVLKDHNLTIGSNGKIKAELQAKSVVVVGEVVGNIIADDKIEIAPSGSVHGDLCAPRVALADGASFKGSIDMGRKSASHSSGASTAAKHEVPLVAKG